MVAATSHGSAARPNASPSESRSSSSDDDVFSRNLCRAILGDTALIRTPYSAASIALQRVNAITPALAAAKWDWECFPPPAQHAGVVDDHPAVRRVAEVPQRRAGGPQ